VTPGLPGTPSVASPEPESASKPSEWPWYAPANLTTTSRPLIARAKRTAPIAASVPELVIRTISTDGTRSTICRASATSAAVAAPKLVPRFAASITAEITAGSAWPRINGPQEPTQSR
jgi:hypothetical protein